MPSRLIQSIPVEYISFFQWDREEKSSFRFQKSLLSYSLVLMKYFIFILLCHQSFSQSINTKMKNLGKSINNIIPIIYSDTEFSKAYHKKFLGQELHKTKDLFHKVKTHFNDPVKKIKYDILQQHLDFSINVFEQGHMSFAQNSLKALPFFCISCHNQDQKKAVVFPFLARDKFDNDLGYAHYLFMVRNYPISKKYYYQYLENSQNIEYEDFQNAIMNLTYIELMIFGQKDSFTKKLKLIKEKKSFNSLMKSDLNDFITSAQSFQKPFEFKTFEELKKFIEASITLNSIKKLSFSNKILSLELMNTRQAIYKWLNQANSKEEIPFLLLWLAQLDDRLNFSLFSGLADLYLKSCVVNYPKSQAAPICLKEYQERIESGFTGSSGTHIPQDIKDEIKRLKLLLKH